jgi:hypothetical protein
VNKTAILKARLKTRLKLQSQKISFRIICTGLSNRIFLFVCRNTYEKLFFHFKSDFEISATSQVITDPTLESQAIKSAKTSLAQILLLYNVTILM